MPPLTAANHLARQGRVSASEIAALMPEGHPYIDARDVYDRLVGLRPIEAPTPAMRLGSILEPAILTAAAEFYGWTVRANRRTFTHKTLGLCATPDAHVIGHTAGQAHVWPAERELVEIKFSGNPTAWLTLPSHVYWQCQAQLMCSPGYRAVWAVVLAGRLRRWRVERNLTASRRIARAVRSMHDLVADGIPPDHEIRDRGSIDPWTSDTPRSMTK